MIISHRHRFIFFNQPMTGSDSFCAYLKAWNEEPVTVYGKQSPRQPLYHSMPPEMALRALEMIGRDCSDYTKLTISSDPFTRLPAIYSRISSTDRFWRLRHRAKIANPTFDEWLSKVKPNQTGAGGAPGQIWRRYGAWSSSAWANPEVVDQVLPVERLSLDLHYVMTSVGIPMPTDQRILKADAHPIRPLSSYAVDRISTLYRTDIDRFGYCPPASHCAA